MARLPDYNALGGRSFAGSGRPIATMDVSGYAKGAAALAEGARDFGRGIQIAGNAIYAAEEKQRAAANDLETARFNTQLSLAELESDNAIKTATGAAPAEGAPAAPQGQPAPAGQPPQWTSGYTDLDTGVTNFTNRATALLSGISDPSLREKATLKVQERIARAQYEAGNRGRAINRDQQVSYLTQTESSVINRAIEDDNPQSRADAIDSHIQHINSYVKNGWLSESQATEWKQKFKNAYGEAYSDAMSRKGRVGEVISDMEAASLNAAFAPTPPRPGPERRSAIQSPMEVAKSFVGADERTDRTVLASFIEKAAGQKLDPAQTAWCAAFLNAALGETGRPGTGSLRARSFLSYGTPTDKPSEGDIVVLTRGNPNGPYGHVGLFAGYDENGNVKVLGGNQGNKVSIASFPAGQVLGFRKPPNVEDGPAQPVQVASADPNALPVTGGPAPPADTGIAPTMAEGDVGWQGPRRPPTIFDAMDAGPREKLLKRMYQVRDAQDRDAAIEAGRVSTERKEQYERQFLDVAAGKGIMPSREEIEQDATLSLPHKNEVLRGWGAANKDALLLTNTAAKLADPSQIFDPTDADDKKGVDALFNKADGAYRLQSGDEQFVVREMVPFFDRTQMVPKSARGMLLGMTRSSKPETVTFALSAMDKLERMNPDAFARDMGKEAVDYVSTYRENLAFKQPQEIVDLLRRSEDPATANARKEMTRAGRELAGKVRDSDIMDHFDPGVFQSEPSKAVDPLINATMRNQFEQLYAEQYVRSGDASRAQSEALKRLGTVWGGSTAATDGASRIMMYPPEKYYPSINGSHSWIPSQLAADAKPFMREGDKFAFIKPDEQTEAAIGRGEAPSYVLVVVGPNGEPRLATDDGGRRARIRFDVKAGMEAVNRTFPDARRRSLLLEDLQPVIDEPRVPFGVAQ